jgi:DNA-binding SARP family transcriptional activator/tetratricopeptide (TPR) repeat protein
MAAQSGLVRLLGPVEIEVDGATRTVPGLRRRAILAALALHRGEIVSVERLCDVVWDGHPPGAAANTLQTHMSWLRGTVGDATPIVTKGRGYCLDLPPGSIDVELADALIEHSAGEDPAQAVSTLGQAMQLWRGDALSDFQGMSWFEERADHLEQLRLRGVELLIDARLALGEHSGVIRQLEQLVEKYPFREQFHRQLMLSLYQAGRQADALAVFRRLRQALAEEFGIDPSEPLRDLEVAVLRQEPTLRWTTQAAPLPVVPAQLPRAVSGFVGRRQILARLDKLMTGQEQTTASIVVISGAPGIGKTTLAAHWAHLAADRFPDGQLFVNLRGFDPTGPPLEAAAALRILLDAFAIPASRIPDTFDSQVGLYRSLLAARRVLIVLDNASDADQVRSLLPAVPGCAALVTSRAQFSSLVATDGAQQITLERLDAEDARTLLAHRVGRSRVDADPDAVKAIIDRCGGLPLALAIAAARASTSPHLSLNQLATDLHGASTPLDTLNAGDRSTDLRAVFSRSYDVLDPAGARMFQLIGLHPGPDITAAAAAHLVNATTPLAAGSLEQLNRMNLLLQPSVGRYTAHDLLRAYAAELAASGIATTEREAAIGRLSEHYLRVASANSTLLDPLLPAISTIALPLPSDNAPADQREALSWFSVEYLGLLALVRHTAAAGLDELTWQLAWTLTTFLLKQGHWDELLQAHTHAHLSAERLGETRATAHAIHGLGLAHARSGRFGEAEPLFVQAMDLFARIDDHQQRARICSSMAWLTERQGRLQEMLEYSQRGLRLYRMAGNLAGEAGALNDIGWAYLLLDDTDQAMSHCRQAVGLHQRLGSLDGEAAAWDSLAGINSRLGNYGEAIRCHNQALRIERQLGDRYNEAVSLDGLGDVHATAGDRHAARQAWAAAYQLLDDLHHPDADTVKAKIDRIANH